LALGTALTQPDTVIASFVVELTGSTVWVGGLSTVLTVAGTLPQLFVARWIEPRPRKMPFLLLAIYLRVFSWGMLAWLIYTIGSERPRLLAWALAGLLAIFYAGGGLGGVPYTDIIGKIIPPGRRGAFFGGRQALAGPLAVGAALLARHVLAEGIYPITMLCSSGWRRWPCSSLRWVFGSSGSHPATTGMGASVGGTNTATNSPRQPIGCDLWLVCNSSPALA
jgi:hypothetical protein